MRQTLLATLLALFCTATLAAAHPDLSAELTAIQSRWAEINYQLPEKEREQAFKRLAERAEAFHRAYPDRAEPLIWQGIVLGSYAGAKGGLGALSLAKAARDALHSAEAIDPAALDGSVYTSLGSLYYKVPGWPLGYGDHDKARRYLQEALALNPDGVDPNFFYGEFLIKEGDTEAGIAALEKALAAPDRPGRALADQGRRAEIRALLAKVRDR